MARSFDYVILMAIPNPRRGERVNVGVAVFLDDRVDIRLPQASFKIRALTGKNWDDRIESAEAALQESFRPGAPTAEILASFHMVEQLLVPSKVGYLVANSAEQYEERVDQILQSLVALPKKERFTQKSRINTEIAAEFRRVKILARGNETIEDHKVVRNFVIDSKEGLAADFALRNGKVHVASTLDLRKQTAGLGEAALKSIVLDKAQKKFSDIALTIGVYAIDQNMRDEFRAHIELLGDYSNELYDWTDSTSRSRLQKRVYDALTPSYGGKLTLT
ncbi:MAG: DUF3037 domain-containing protein [Thalassobaculaceae bacterium]